MPAYVIARVDISNPEQYATYTARTPREVAKFGGRFIVRTADVLTVEGPAETRRVVVIEFPSLEQAKAFYFSDGYEAVKARRAGAAEGQFIIVDGYPESAWASVLAASQAVAD
ncbi:MAG: DUF1330 domain-containing protein [Gemmatimonadaceae bacterium]|jgi:uncharacterized protein (DUF1330 family)|nr:DUF1330 domain-containing protein [Gemmatimonadaceae bacterium]